MLRKVYLSALIAFIGELSRTNAQTFSDLNMHPAFPGISTSCFNALNTTVNCPSFLAKVSINNARLNATSVGALCTTQCLNSLQSARTTITNGCKNATTDFIQYFDGNTYPATFVVDHFIYTYNLACRKDKASGNYCDPLLITWLNQTTPFTMAQNCSDCIIGSFQTQLNSPFDYSDQLAANFRNLTSSCSATGYAYTSPSKYVLSTSTASTTTASGSPATTNPACTTSYTVKSGDSCNSISQAYNVSTYAVINAGGLDINCDDLQVGQALCLGGMQCTTYAVQETDTCTSIINAQSGGVTGTQFLSWNPNINSLCGNLYNFVGQYICISPPGGSLGVVTPTSNLAISTPSSAAPKPTNAPSQSNSNCGTWYTVQEGDYCDKLSVQFGISLKDFYFLNPEINNPNCTNLDLGLSYCVQAVGDIQTYSGYPKTTPFYTLTSASYSTSVASSATFGNTPATTPTQLPKALGTKSNCTSYRNYITVQGVVDQSSSPDASTFLPYVNNCTYITSVYGIAFNDLITWNPSLKNDTYNCNFQPGYSYCVSMGAPSPVPTENFCLPVNGSTIHNSTIATCSCFTIVDSYDNGTYTCADMEKWFRLDPNKISTWNPWVGSNCDTGIFSTLNGTDSNAVCIGVNGTAPTTTAGTGPITTTKTSATMGPTQTGIISSCTQYYTVQSGDSCASIEAMFGISFAQFYSWNPAIGSNCQSLYLGYSYCVAAPSSTTTTAAPAPTQSGTAAGCSTYYTVQSGDSCDKIETTFGISFATFYKWNTGIGNNCQSLWVGYGYCVTGGPP